MQGKTVLVVDDEADIRDSVAELLTEHGYDVQTASNGELALRALAAYATPEPDVVLLDMRMPVMTGTEVLKTLATMGRLASLHVIVISGHAHEASGLGAKRLIRKPVSAEEILSAVREGCGES